MDLVIKGKKSKKGLIIKAWERCSRSFGGGRHAARLNLKSKSWPRSSGAGARATGIIVPEGCFSVYVGPKKERFVIRTQCLNHHLFKILLEEAESEYGYKSEGPLELPCEVDIFVKVLMEMDCDVINPPRCSFRKTYSSYHLLTNSSRLISLNN